MSLAQDAAVRADQSDPKNAAVLKRQFQRRANPFMRILVWIEFDPAFNAVKARDGEAGLFDEALKSAETIVYLPEKHSVQHQLSNARTLFN